MVGIGLLRLVAIYRFSQVELEGSLLFQMLDPN